MRLLGSSCLLVASIAGVAQAASFSVTCDGDLELARRGCTIWLVGSIALGDGDRLRNIIRQPLSEGWHYSTLLLNSPGGDIQEAIALGGVVREAMLKTSTARFVKPDHWTPVLKMNWACVSACFLVWVTGIERFSMSGYSKSEGPFGIGLHRPYFSPEAYRSAPAKIAEAQQAITIAVRDYLRREQVPEELIQKMLERSSKEVYWLHESGDAFALNGRAPWFEEMMIARCKFDPVYDRESQAQTARILAQGQLPQLNDPAQRAYIAWRQKYNACEYQARIDAQAAFRR